MRSLGPITRAAALALSLAIVPESSRGAPPPPTADEAPAGRHAERSRQEVRPAFERHLPAVLLEGGPRGLLWWQWIAVPVLVAIAVAAGALLGFATRLLLARLAARSRASWGVVLDRFAGPLAAMWAIGVFLALEPWLALDGTAEEAFARILRAAIYLVFFWAGFRSVDVAFSTAAQATWARANARIAGLFPLGRKTSKVVLLALGLVAVLNELGFHVASLLAGLGIGGIVLALAAQKTVENLFGSVAIGIDQPFSVGDFVKVDDVLGTVEAIGMRSTRIRTLDRTIVTIPNGKLSEMRAETFAARDRFRLHATLGLSYDTSADEMRAVLAGIEAALRADPRIWPDVVSVRFVGLSDSTLDVEVMAWLQMADWNEFTLARQELLLRFMDVVERAGTSFAFPTRTVHVVEEGPTRRS
jgi:MscS family membrane protein